MTDGIAASFYGISTVGKAIHRSKYENGGDFPGHLLELTLKAFRKKHEREKFDLLVYIPPTKSGNLVRNFAVRLSDALKIPISHDLVKAKATQEQKIFESSYSKKNNVKDAFAYKTPSDLVGKNILLFDDICDSGATLKEVGKLFSNLGAVKIS